MKYTGIFKADINDTNNKCSGLTGSVQIRIEANAVTPEEAFFRISRLRYDVIDYELYDKAGWSFSEIRDENDNIVMKIAYENEKVIEETNGIQVTEPILLSYENVCQGIREGLITVSDNQAERVGENSKVIINVADSHIFFAGLSEKAKVFDSLEDMKKNAPPEYYKYTINTLTAEKIESFITENPLFYNGIKETLFKSFMEKESRYALTYDEIFDGLKSGYISYDYDICKHTLTVYTGHADEKCERFFIPEFEKDDFGSTFDDVEFSNKGVKKIQEMFNKHHIEFQKELRDQIEEHIFDKIPSEVQEAAFSSKAEGVIVICCTNHEDESRVMTYIPAEEEDFRLENIVQEFYNCKNTQVLSELKDFLEASAKDEYDNTSVYEIIVENGAISEYFSASNMTTDEMLEETKRYLDKDRDDRC